MFDLVILGAGLTEAVLAECLARSGGQRVLMEDCRSHIGDNAFDKHGTVGIVGPGLWQPLRISVER